MFYKKTLVLSSINGGNEKAVVNIEYEQGELVGNVKLYNFKDEPDGILTLGILDGSQVIKAGLTKTSNMRYAFKLDSAKELTGFSCGLININHGEATPILHGATDGVPTSEERLAEVAMHLGDSASVEQIKKALDANQIELEDQEEIEKLIDSEMCEASGEKCTSCKYRHAFFTETNELVETENEHQSESFFDGIKEQIDTLFQKYPAEDFLSEIIPNSKWVKVDYEEKGEYYVLGLIYEDDIIKYVCYGVPGMWEEEAPADLNGFCQWLPLDSNRPQEYGYWITYQNAESGESVKVDFKVI